MINTYPRNVFGNAIFGVASIHEQKGAFPVARE